MYFEVPKDERKIVSQVLTSLKEEREYPGVYSYKNCNWVVDMNCIHFRGRRGY